MDLDRRLLELGVDLDAILPTELRVFKAEILLACVVVAVSLLLLLLSKALGGGSAGGNKAVIVGPCNSGKTCLFYKLVSPKAVDGQPATVATVASMQENDGTAQVLNERRRAVGSVRVVDIPGHERLRHKLHQHLNDARAVVFVLDSADIAPHKLDAAEELFEVLTHPSISRRRVPILLACNKADLDTQAYSVDFIRKTLEKQLDAMRKTRIALSPEAAAKAAVLGKGDKPLTLAGLKNNVTVEAISALTDDVGKVHAFLHASMR